MAGAPAAAGTRGATTSTPAVAGSIGGSVFHAASAGMMAGAPAAAGSRGAAPVVANGSGGSVFPAESAGMMAGTPAAAGWNGAAFQAASSAVRPPPTVALASDDHEDWQVRRTATATRRQSIRGDASDDAVRVTVKLSARWCLGGVCSSYNGGGNRADP